MPGPMPEGGALHPSLVTLISLHRGLEGMAKEGLTMCSETGSKYTGILLSALATAAIIANLLLYFPNGQVLEPAKITDLVWFFQGFLGAGLLVMVPALMLLRGRGGDCCAHRCGMLFPALLAVLGTMGAIYCVLIPSLGLLGAPLCDMGSGNYTYPFRNNTLDL
ncbi:Transmembrane 4 L6 family member 1 [Manis javanica]|nr:Transmembrane 4 L6 family member 1 [Manis javanica]